MEACFITLVALWFRSQVRANGVHSSVAQASMWRSPHLLPSR